MKNLTEYIEGSYLKYPDKTALRYEQTAITYKELRNKARKIASGLLSLQAQGSYNPVAVFLQRGTEPVICYMAALYSARAYVPINYSLPDNRLRTTFEILEPVCVITDDENKDRLSAICNCPVVTPSELYEAGKENDERVDMAVSRSCDCDGAYIIFTSGSTGAPKGVTVSHRGVIDYVDSMLCEFEINENDVLGMQSPLYFDISVFDMYVTFCTGAELVIIPDKIFLYPKMVPEYVNENNITFIYWVPTVFDSIASSGILDECKFEKVKTVLFAGEIMHNKTLNTLRRAMPDCVYANLFGPTETSVISTFFKVEEEFEDSQPLPVGKPCKNTKLLLLDENNKEITRDGVRGEIVFGGIGIGLGYWNNKEISDKVFVQNPLNERYFERVYRTGDVGYYNNGVLMFAGRADSQIKHRGNRIELADIECAANSVETVEKACALYDGEKQEIVLFVQSDVQWNLRKFNLELKKHLPSYMLPSRLVIVEQMPYTPNGKINRIELKKALTEEI